MRVPMIVSWPGQVREGVVSEALVELVDLPQTLLEAAGLPEGEGMQGKSLWPLLTGAVPAGSHKPYVLCEYFDALGLPDPRHTRGSMYFDGRWKLSVYHTHGTGELYDLRDDPSELNDLWDDPAHRELRCALTARAFDALMLVSEPGPRRTGSY